MPRREERHETVKQSLAELRGEKGWSQVQAAHACEMPLSTYRDAENGKPISELNFERLAKGFGCELTYLKSLPLRSLVDVRTRFLAWEREVEGPDTLRLDAVGIDMTDGEKFLYAATNGRASQTIKCRILMLAGPSSELTCFDDKTSPVKRRDVSRWSDAAATNLKSLRAWLAMNGLGATNTVTEVTIKSYNDIPVLHGLRATKLGRQMYGLTRCELDQLTPQSYDWGDSRYAIEELAEGDKRSDDATAWDDLFQHEWNDSKNREVLSWPNLH